MTERAVEVSSIEDASAQRNRPSPSREDQYPLGGTHRSIWAASDA
jgi:hypothetical protein